VCVKTLGKKEQILYKCIEGGQLPAIRGGVGQKRKETGCPADFDTTSHLGNTSKFFPISCQRNASYSF
jgi:hypothetical protein